MKRILYLLPIVAIVACVTLSCKKDDFKTTWEKEEVGRIDIPRPEPMEPEPLGSSGKMYRPIMVSHAPSGGSNSWVDDKTVILNNIIGFTPDTSFLNYEKRTNRYGSRTDWPKYEATGRFYTKKISGRWWVIDPDGYVYHCHGITTFTDGQRTLYPEAFKLRYGSQANWLRMSAREFQKNLGVNGVGGFLTPNTHIINYNKANDYLPIVYSPSFSFLTTTKALGGWTGSDEQNENELACVFYPNFYEVMQQSVKTLLSSYAGDKNLFGVFSDNEKNFSAMSVRILRQYMTISDPTHPGRVAAENFMRSKGGTPTPAGYDANPNRELFNNEFAGIVAEKYYKACRDGIKTVDPKMLYLGSRLHGTPKTYEFVIKAAAKYCDVISINYYLNWSPELIKSWENWVDAPFVITEFWAQGLDLGHDGTVGTGFKVHTQFDKAAFMQNFTIGLLQSKLFVGWFWFRYQDPLDSNAGVYDKNFKIHPLFGQYMRDINYNVYPLIDFFDQQ